LLKAISGLWQFNTTEEHFAIESNSSFHEAGLLKLNCDKALFYLQWKPVLNFVDTARFTGEWYNRFYNQKAAGMYDYTVQQIHEYESFASKKELAWTV